MFDWRNIPDSQRDLAKHFQNFYFITTDGKSIDLLNSTSSYIDPDIRDALLCTAVAVFSGIKNPLHKELLLVAVANSNEKMLTDNDFRDSGVFISFKKGEEFVCKVGILLDVLYALGHIIYTSVEFLKGE